TTTEALPDLERSTFNDVASSIIVDNGTWEACTEANFKGTCTELVPGDYVRLHDLHGVVASIREVTPSTAVVIEPDSRPVTISRGAPVIVENPPTQVAPALAGRMVLFQGPNFSGRSAVVENTRAPDLDWANFSRPASSLRVESGTWLVCTELGYQGDCQLL